MDFQKARKAGLRQLRGSSARGGRVLCLGEALALLGSGHWGTIKRTIPGVTHVPINDILGTEDRSKDFSWSFYPLHGWMRERWNRVARYLAKNGPHEPLDLLLCGGRYFVRDGNHRVSVARARGIEFLAARVVELHWPLPFPPGFTRKMLPLYKDLLDFNQRTSLFNQIPLDRFELWKSKSISSIEESITIHHRAWMTQRDGQEAPLDQVITDWYAKLYVPTELYIKTVRLPDLLHGHGRTDVFCLLMDQWRLTPHASISQVWEEFYRVQRKKRPLAFVLYRIHLHLGPVLASPLEERRWFFDLCQLQENLPQGEIPPGPGQWYRFLAWQVSGSHLAWLRRLWQKDPSVPELVGHWYTTLFEPALAWYKESGIDQPFWKFYTTWMKLWGSRVRKESLGFRASFELYLSMHQGRKSTRP